MGLGFSAEKSLRIITVDSKQHAQQLLNMAEKLDFYLEECHDDKRNSMARQHMTYSANTVSQEDRVILDTISTIALPRRLTTDLQTVYLVQLMPTADGGMPHTRPLDSEGIRKQAIICYANAGILTDQKTLIHELWHVHQRIFAKEWNSIFLSLGWTEWMNVLPASLEHSRRYNPDTIDAPLWIYKNKWVPVPIFRDISKPNVGEVDIWFYDVSNKFHVKNVPSELLSFWPDLPASAYEHPRELTAYLLADASSYPHSPALQKLVELLGQIALF